MVLEKFSLEGKVAVVTGAAGNLGSHMSRALAKAGADVVVTDFRAEPLEQTAAAVRQLGRKSIAPLADITDSRQVDRVIESTIAEFGKVDILVNNAGMVRGQQRKPIWDITAEEWHLGMDVNLSGAFFFCRAVSKHLVAQKSGKVINIATLSGLRGWAGDYLYGIPKSGVIQLTRVLATTWGRDNIQVNAIAPGIIGIDTGAQQPQSRETPGTGGEFIPKGRFATPQDVASLCLFLASDASNYITGGIFAIDGGVLAGEYAPTGYAPIITMKED